MAGCAAVSCRPTIRPTLLSSLKSLATPHSQSTPTTPPHTLSTRITPTTPSFHSRHIGCNRALLRPLESLL
ncbi:hypothetical protein PCANC_28299, partial [Puccinia coronata f. sp. avenae]